MSTKIQVVGIVTIVIMGLAPSPAPAGLATFQIQDITPSGAYWPWSHKLNDHDQVVGHSYTSPGQQEGFLWDELLGMRALGSLGEETSSVDINNFGQVVGVSRTQLDIEHAFRWENNTMTDLGSLIGPTGYSYATGINNLGHVAGYSDTINGSRHAVLWDNNAMRDLNTLGGYASYARAINDIDQIVGESFTVEGQWHAFHWDNGRMTDLGTLGGNRSEAYDINNNGLIAGYSRLTDGPDHYNSQAVLWDSWGQILDLGDLGSDQGSMALALNDPGQVVGYAYNPLGEKHAFLWDNVNGMIDLNSLISPDSDWLYLETAFDINNAGHIVGLGYQQVELGEECLTEPHVFLITPEPASLTFLFIGAGIVLSRKRK